MLGLVRLGLVRFSVVKFDFIRFGRFCKVWFGLTKVRLG